MMLLSLDLCNLQHSSDACKFVLLNCLAQGVCLTWSSNRFIITRIIWCDLSQLYHLILQVMWASLKLRLICRFTSESFVLYVVLLARASSYMSFWHLIFLSGQLLFQSSLWIPIHLEYFWMDRLTIWECIIVLYNIHFSCYSCSESCSPALLFLSYLYYTWLSIFISYSVCYHQNI